jgi:hypothetical protein
MALSWMFSLSSGDAIASTSFAAEIAGSMAILSMNAFTNFMLASKIEIFANPCKIIYSLNGLRNVKNCVFRSKKGTVVYACVMGDTFFF